MCQDFATFWRRGTAAARRTVCARELPACRRKSPLETWNRSGDSQNRSGLSSQAHAHFGTTASTGCPRTTRAGATSAACTGTDGGSAYPRACVAEAGSSTAPLGTRLVHSRRSPRSVSEDRRLRGREDPRRGLGISASGYRLPRSGSVQRALCSQPPAALARRPRIQSVFRSAARRRGVSRVGAGARSPRR